MRRHTETAGNWGGGLSLHDDTAATALLVRGGCLLPILSLALLNDPHQLVEYLIDVDSCLGRSLVEWASEFFSQALAFLLRYLAVRFEIAFGANQDQRNFILSLHLSWRYKTADFLENKKKKSELLCQLECDDDKPEPVGCYVNKNHYEIHEPGTYSMYRNATRKIREWVTSQATYIIQKLITTADLRKVIVQGKKFFSHLKNMVVEAIYCIKCFAHRNRINN